MTSFRYLLIFGMLSSCQVNRPPEVNISTPRNGQVFRVGDTIKVEAELADPDILLGQYLHVLAGKNYSDTVINFEDHDQRNSYRLSGQFLLHKSDTVKIIAGAWGGSSILVEKDVTIYVQ